MSTPLIKVENLIKNYYNDGLVTKVLHGLSFEINKGEFVAIMGPSGSGKSTLMYILGFLDTPTSGKFYFKGKDASELSDDEMAYIRNFEIGFVFQSFNLLPRISILENVKLPLSYSKKDVDADKMARRALEAVGLSHRLDYSPNKLSGGEKQRVAIARALVNEPAVIFADEPTGNLDSKSGEQIMEILEDLNDKGHTIILVTHETYTAEYAERVIKIRDGLIIQDRQVDHRHRVKTEGFVK